MEDPEELVDKFTRKELNKIAKEEGVENPEALPRKLAVAKEIVKARKTKEHIKKPVGLYIEDKE